MHGNNCFERGLHLYKKVTETSGQCARFSVFDNLWDYSRVIRRHNQKRNFSRSFHNFAIFSIHTKYVCSRKNSTRTICV